MNPVTYQITFELPHRLTIHINDWPVNWYRQSIRKIYIETLVNDDGNSVSVMRLRLRLFPFSWSMMVMMVMMMAFLLGCIRLLCWNIVDDEFRTVAFRVVVVVAIVAAAEILSVSRFVHGLFASKWRVIRFVARCLMKVLPGLAIVAIQTSSALGRAAVEARDGVAVRRGSVSVVFAASATIPGKWKETRFNLRQNLLQPWQLFRSPSLSTQQERLLKFMRCLQFDTFQLWILVQDISQWRDQLQDK